MCYLGPTGGDFSVFSSDLLTWESPDPSVSSVPQVVLRENYSDSCKHSKEDIASGVNTVAMGDKSGSIPNTNTGGAG